MITLARVLTGGHGDADDLAQEVFVRAWRSLRGFRGDSTFRTWLHRVAINVVRTSRVKEGRLRRLFGQPPSREGAFDPPASDEPVDAARARGQAVEHALSTLPEELRVPVTLRDVQGLEYKDIAALLNVPIGTVESRILRARQRLRPLLESLWKRNRTS